MKQYLITFLVAVTACLTSKAQTRPQQSLYMFNYPAINPAATGIEDYGQVQAGLRRQWAKIDGAPVTYWISGNMRLKTKKEKNETPEANALVSKGHGLGVNLFNDEVGPYSTINFNVGYAYHLPLSSSLALSAGFAGGVQHTRYDLSKSIYPDQPYDPATGAQAAALQKKYSPDLNAGILLNGKKFFAGVSFMQVIPSKFIESSNSQSKLRSQLLGSLGYSFLLNEDGTSLWLSSVVKSDFFNPLRYDVSAKLRYRDLLWVGASYRKKDAVGGSFGLNITKKLTMGYMYEWGINNYFSSYSKGSHEFCIGLKFLKENQSHLPKMGW